MADFPYEVIDVVGRHFVQCALCEFASSLAGCRHYNARICVFRRWKMVVAMSTQQGIIDIFKIRQSRINTSGINSVGFGNGEWLLNTRIVTPPHEIPHEFDK